MWGYLINLLVTGGLAAGGYFLGRSTGKGQPAPWTLGVSFVVGVFIGMQVTKG
jgi:hypothetical protein